MLGDGDVYSHTIGHTYITVRVTCIIIDHLNSHGAQDKSRTTGENGGHSVPISSDVLLWLMNDSHRYRDGFEGVMEIGNVDVDHRLSRRLMRACSQAYP